MSHAAKVKLARKMAPRNPERQVGIFQSKGWYARKDGIAVSIIKKNIRKAAKKAAAK